MKLLYPLILLLFNCTQDIDSDSLVEKHGLIYRINPKKVFSGNLIDYHWNGEVRQEGRINNGKRDGKWIYYFQNGQVGVEKKYKDGKMDGKWIYYYGNGQISSEHHYIDGMRNSTWIWYSENGRIEKREDYMNGKVLKP